MDCQPLPERQSSETTGTSTRLHLTATPQNQKRASPSSPGVPIAHQPKKMRMDMDVDMDVQSASDQQQELSEAGEGMSMVAAPGDTLSQLAAKYEAIFEEQTAIIHALRQENQGLRRVHHREPSASGPQERQEDDGRAAADALERELSKWKADVALKAQEIQKKEHQIHALHEMLSTAKRERLDQQHPAALVQGPDDSTVVNSFKSLTYAIVNLTSIKFNGYPYYKPTKKDHKEFFAGLTATEEDYMEYLSQSDGLKALFFQAVIWRKLINHLLHSPIIAIHCVGEPIIKETVLKGSPEALQRFHAWRSYTAEFLDNVLQDTSLWSRSQDGILRDACVEDMTDLLSRYSSCGGRTEGLKNDLDNVADQAYRLALAMAKSRASWVCCMTDSVQSQKPGRSGFSVSNKMMNVVQVLEGGQKDRVDLVVAPALLKYGSGAGEDYEACEVKAKAAVVAYNGR